MFKPPSEELGVGDRARVKGALPRVFVKVLEVLTDGQYLVEITAGPGIGERREYAGDELSKIHKLKDLEQISPKPSSDG